MFQQFRLSRRAVISHFVVSLGICCLSNFGSRRGRGPTSVGRIAQAAYTQRNCSRESFALYEQISMSSFELPKRTAIFACSKKTLLSSISLNLRVSRLQIKIMWTRFSGEHLQAWHIRSADYSPETSNQANSSGTPSALERDFFCPVPSPHKQSTSPSLPKQ